MSRCRRGLGRHPRRHHGERPSAPAPDGFGGAAPGARPNGLANDVARGAGRHRVGSLGWELFSSATIEGLHARDWATVIHPADQERVRAAWRAGGAAGSPYSVEYRISRVSGGYRWVISRGVPLRGSDGSFASGRDVRDIDEASARRKAWRARRPRLRGSRCAPRGRGFARLGVGSSIVTGDRLGDKCGRAVRARERTPARGGGRENGPSDGPGRGCRRDWRVSRSSGTGRFSPPRRGGSRRATRAHLT
jgi:hypothetical protein